METTIQLKSKTVQRLKYFKEFSKESYDEILNKVLDSLEEGELTEVAEQKIVQGMKDVKYGRVISLEEYAKKRGISL